ncbi:uncharacterized protein LOC124161044 isoform X2 [Ischnura elegans]|uniref:uncharacterized protein LOC124161044 isoform X2 n=1 Tax=Ischnura elegans TaxID=197161 RepID=UPI001ED87C12|nr:uncharacterized protein LOC124161044 isoform X2 [Ischnura elegans]
MMDLEGMKEYCSFPWMIGVILLLAFWKKRNEYGKFCTQMLEKEKLIKDIQQETRPNEYAFDDITLLGLEAQADHHIQCIDAALTSIPKFCYHHKELRQEKKGMMHFQEEIIQAQRKYAAYFSISPEKQEEFSWFLSISNLHSKDCSLQKIIRESPIENVFWSQCTPSQSKELIDELNLLKDKYPDKSEGG